MAAAPQQRHVQQRTAAATSSAAHRNELLRGRASEQGNQERSSGTLLDSSPFEPPGACVCVWVGVCVCLFVCVFVCVCVFFYYPFNTLLRVSRQALNSMLLLAMASTDLDVRRSAHCLTQATISLRTTWKMQTKSQHQKFTGSCL